jgi:hypothetical protein
VDDSCRSHTKYDGSYWVNDAQGIPLARVCPKCKAEKLKGFRPEILTGYTQKDVDEPIEAEDDSFAGR